MSVRVARPGIESFGKSNPLPPLTKTSTHHNSSSSPSNTTTSASPTASINASRAPLPPVREPAGRGRPSSPSINPNISPPQPVLKAPSGLAPVRAHRTQPSNARVPSPPRMQRPASEPLASLGSIRSAGLPLPLVKPADHRLNRIRAESTGDFRQNLLDEMQHEHDMLELAKLKSQYGEQYQLILRQSESLKNLGLTSGSTDQPCSPGGLTRIPPRFRTPPALRPIQPRRIHTTDSLQKPLLGSLSPLHKPPTKDPPAQPSNQAVEYSKSDVQAPNNATQSQAEQNKGGNETQPAT